MRLPALALVFWALSFTLSRADSSKLASLFAAARSGDLGGLKVLDKAASRKKWLNEREAVSGQTLLVAASFAGQPGAIRYLLEKGADRTIGDKDGITPMHAAGLEGQIDASRLLLLSGFDPSIHLRDGFTPMHRACWGKESRHAATVKVFLMSGMDPQQKATDGRDCMSMTRNAETTQLVREWLNPRIDVVDLLAFAASAFAKKGSKPASMAQTFRTCLAKSTGSMFLAGFRDAVAQASHKEIKKVVHVGLRQLAGNVAALTDQASSQCEGPDIAIHSASLMSLQRAAQGLESALGDESSFTFRHPKVLIIGGKDVAARLHRLLRAEENDSGEKGSGKDVGTALGDFLRVFAPDAAATHKEL